MTFVAIGALRVSYHTFQRVNNKGADQTVRIHRMVCALRFTFNKVTGGHQRNYSEIA